MDNRPPTNANSDEERKVQIEVNELEGSRQAELERQKSDADMQARYSRFRGRNPLEAGRQENLLRDARQYTAAGLDQALASLPVPSPALDADVEFARDQIRQRLVRKAWDEFLPRHRDHSDFQLTFAEFDAALWFEGYPSLNDCTCAAIADRAAAIAETVVLAPAASNEGIAEVEVAPAHRSTAGRNIDRLRKECGWSFDQLAAKTGLDKKLILGHVNQSKRAVPRTLKTYADAFAKELKRAVSVAEIAS